MKNFKKGIKGFFNLSPEERFLKYVDKKDGCWLWTGYVSKYGYGSLSINDVNVAAHRYSYEKHYGEFDKSLFVCHKCDVRNCVNPEHLFLGTHTDNMIDMASKGRHKAQKNRERAVAHMRAIPRARGDQSGHTKLSVNDVIKIIDMRKSGKTFEELAKMFNTSPQTISYAFNGKTFNSKKAYHELAKIKENK